MNNIFNGCNNLKKIIINENSYNNIKSEIKRKDIEIKFA